MKFSSRFIDLDQRISKIHLSKYANIFFALILCSKFYYLWGTIDYLAPAAPMYAILFRDVAAFGFLLFFGFVGRRYLKELKWFWMLWFLGLSLSLLQLGAAKDFATWAQHYFRNVLAMMLFFPVIYGIFRSEIKISIARVLAWVFWINVCVSYIQILLNENFQRPSGIFGDAILSTIILLLGLIGVFLSNKNSVKLVAFFLAIPLIYLMSSVSALISFVIGVTGLAIIGWKSWKGNLSRVFVLVLVLIGIGTVTVFGTGRLVNSEGRGFEGISAKIKYLYEAAFCTGACWQNWSYRGRIASNQRPLEFCEGNPLGCLFGNYESPLYERMESTLGSVWINWGGLFCSLYLIWIFSHLRGLRWMLAEASSSDVWLWVGIILTGLTFMVFNTLTYRFPLNILLYAAFAQHAFVMKMERKKMPT